MPDGNSDVVPPESIPNSEVKRVSGDGSVGSPHVRVAHRQAPNYEEARSSERAFFVSVLCTLLRILLCFFLLKCSLQT